MSKRAFGSAFLSGPPDRMLAATNSSDAAQPQVQPDSAASPGSPSRLPVPGAWPYEDAAVESIAPATTSFFTTIGRWVTLPKRLFQQFWGARKIKAVPVIRNDGSIKKRLVDIGPGDEPATPSPSARARAYARAYADLSRRRRATPPSPLSPERQSALQDPITPALHFASALAIEIVTNELQAAETPAHSDVSISDLDIAENAWTSTPLQPPKPYSATSPPWLLEMKAQWAAEKAAKEKAARAREFTEVFTTTRRSSPYKQKLRAPFRTTLTPVRRKLIKNQMRRQQVRRVQTEAEGQRFPAAENDPASPATVSTPYTFNMVQETPSPSGTDIATDDFSRASSEAYQEESSEFTFTSDVDGSSQASFVSDVDGPSQVSFLSEDGPSQWSARPLSDSERILKTPSHHFLAGENAAGNAALPETEKTSDFYEPEQVSPGIYENDLGDLSDASPLAKKNVRWAKFARAKPFYFDRLASDMLDSTIESIKSGSSPVKENPVNGNMTQDNTTHVAESEAEAVSEVEGAHIQPQEYRDEASDQTDSASEDGGFCGVPASTWEDSDEDSLEELQPSIELIQDLREDFLEKLAVDPPLPSPPPSPPAIPELVSSLAEDELEKLKQAAVKAGMQPEAKVNKKLTAKDLGTLLPDLFGSWSGGWLNDVIINEYLLILTAEIKKRNGWTIRSSSATPVHAFSSFWYESVKNGGARSISGWGKKFKLQGAQYLDADLVLYPICDGNHWRLLAIKPKARSIEYFDSMGKNGDVYIKKVQEILAYELKDLWHPEEWSVEPVQRSTQQSNHKDCGVFTLLNALTLLRNEEPNRVIVSDGMEAARQRIAFTVLSGNPTTEFD